MGFHGSEDSKMLGFRVIPIHKRSKSFPDKKKVEENDLGSSMEASNRVKLDMGPLKACVTSNVKQSPKKEVHNSLKQEILQLEKRLQDQFQVRSALEKALGYRTSINENINDVEMPKPATELIKEIAVLEVEVMHLEQYLLSLYRKAFNGQTSTFSPPAKEEKSKSALTTPRCSRLDASKAGLTSKRESSAVQSGCQSIENPWKESKGIGGEEKLLDSSVHRCHSSLSQRSAFSTRTSPPGESSAKAVRYCHSQPLSMMEYAQNASSNIISLAEHLGTRISDHIPETPNRISEDMIKCMSTIYCKLANPALTHNGLSSPNSSLSSLSGFSPREQCDMWSPGFRNNSSFDVRLDNPFHVEGLKEFSGPYSTMVEVPWIYRDSQKLGDIDHLLQNFRSLISRLEEVDPRKLKHDEKLAFWINIHNALVMHAFLAYGIPQNNVKRVFLLLKAAYNIGGHTISADTIQSSILGCRMSRPGQWLRLFLSPRTKFKAGDERQAYVIDHPEPLLHFALCSGSHSDPAVRVYNPKRVIQELEAAKEEYIRASFGVRKDQKILIPKIVESFAKDAGLGPAGVLEMIQQTVPDSLKKSIKKCQSGKSRKSIEWIPHNFAFRYLISKELVK
ncbi:Ternary complex factor MIP1, leucine-zipper [Parasponia andersonii]|uniref:Ternary complex factor MIP1, leucine-zipper n=1 Tax=Parasponia andersonii TaxID=3476 RepID=A0A2P5BZA7_PARAD|nr:Ternary complex factor MIP1, leucine-zipper [Parasponia andersonii]